MEIAKTGRGFNIINFTDFYGEKCSLQKSSIVYPECIWFGIDDPDPKVLASEAASVGVRTDKKTGWIKYEIPENVLINSRMHLNRKQVEALLPCLQKFVETGEL